MHTSLAILCPGCGAQLPPLDSSPFHCPHCGAAFEVTLQPAVSAGTSVRLYSAGQNKIMAIKAVRSLTGLGLREAKDLVEGTMPVDLRVASSKMLHEALKDLEQAGAQYEVVSEQAPPRQTSRETAYAGPPPDAHAGFVTLLDAGPTKLEVIKTIRMLTGYGLGESKSICDGAPTRFPVLQGKTVAQVADAFRDTGARVRVEPR